MKIYTKSCLACTDKALWRALKQFALDNNMSIEERRVGLKKEWREEAEAYGIELPFAVNGNKAINLKEPLEKLL